MSYIAPNSTIKFLTSVRLNSNRQDTIYFATLEDQTNYFWNKQGVVYEDYYYVRQTGKVRIQVNPNNSSYQRLTSCVYMMFKNTDFENKWYYAFITKVNEYVNNETMEISFQLDPIQSFMFEPDGTPCYVPLKCMIERQTPVTDTAPVLGHYMISESFDTGEYLFQGDDENRFDYITVEQDSSLSFSHNSTLDVDLGNGNGNILNWGDDLGVTQWYPVLFTTVDATGSNVDVSGIIVGGLYTGLNCYIFASKAGANTFLNEISQAGFSDQVVSMCMWPSTIIGALLRVPGANCTDLQGNPIAYLSQVGDKTIILTDTDMTTGRYVRRQISIPVPKIVRESDGSFTMHYAAQAGGASFSIKANNLKCFCSQFFGLYITNGQGAIETYQLEYWLSTLASNNELKYDIDFFFIPTASANAMLCPINYKGRSRQYNMTLQDFPQCAFTTSTYRQWLARNEPLLAYEKTAIEKQNDLSMLQAENAMMTARGSYSSSTKQADIDQQKEDRRRGTITGGLSEILDMTNSVAGGLNGHIMTQSEINMQQIQLQLANAERNLASAERSQGEVQAAVNTNTQLLNAKQKAQKSVAAMSSPAYHGNAIGESKVISGDMRFHVGYYVSPQEYINKADSYYDLYGYEVDEIGIPNIAAGNYWTYVKTNGFSARNDAVPDEYMREIAALFDGGIRFWKNGDDIGNYRPGNNNYILN